MTQVPSLTPELPHVMGCGPKKDDDPITEPRKASEMEGKPGKDAVPEAKGGKRCQRKSAPLTPTCTAKEASKIKPQDCLF